MILAVALMSTSCCKDDPIVVLPLIEVGEFEGYWKFESITLDEDFAPLNGTYSDCDADVNLEWDYVVLYLDNVTPTTLNLYSSCTDGNEVPSDDLCNYQIDLIDGETIINCGILEFKVIDYTEPYLELELANSSDSDHPIGAVYLLKRDDRY